MSTTILSEEEVDAAMSVVLQDYGQPGDQRYDLVLEAFRAVWDQIDDLRNAEEERMAQHEEGER